MRKYHFIFFWFFGVLFFLSFSSSGMCVLFPIQLSVVVVSVVVVHLASHKKQLEENRWKRELLSNFFFPRCFSDSFRQVFAELLSLRKKKKKNRNKTRNNERHFFQLIESFSFFFTCYLSLPNKGTFFVSNEQFGKKKSPQSFYSNAEERDENVKQKTSHRYRSGLHPTGK